MRIAVVALLIVACSSETTAPPAGFAPCANPRYPVSFFEDMPHAGAGGFALADFDGDGTLDMVLANGDDQTVSVRRGLVGGAFGSPTLHVTGQAANRVATADLDGDGDIDAVVLTMDYGLQTGTVRVLENAGDGTFTVGAAYETAFGLELALGDLDDDGLPDIAVSNRTSNLVSIFHNLGGATFAPRVDHANGGLDGYDGRDIVLGDFDADGRLDIATTANDDDLSVMLRGATGFTPHLVPISTGQNFGTNAIATGDLDGNGRIDIVVSYQSGDAEVARIGAFLNQDGVTYVAGNQVDVPLFSAPLAIGDVDGDGLLDVVVGHPQPSRSASQSETFSVLRNLGGGALAMPDTHVLNTTTAWMALADVDGDTHLDITFSIPSGVAVVKARGDGTFEVPSAVGPPVSLGTANLVAVDLDGDGHQDLVVGGDAGLTVIHGTGAGAFADPIIYPGGADPPLSIAVVDLDGNGRPDVVFGSGLAGATITIMLNTSQGLGSPISIATAAAAPTSLAVGDLDGDALPDIVVGGSGYGGRPPVPGARDVFLNQGGGSFALASRVPGSTSDVKLVDINRDGVLDLLETREQSYLSLGVGDGSFAPGVPLPLGSYDLVDVNNDAIPDLVHSDTTGTLQVELGYGDGTYVAPIAGATTIGPWTVSDLDGDHVADLVVARSTTLELWLGRGDGTFAAHQTIWNRGGASEPVVADFNGDGFADLANLNGGPQAVDLRFQRCEQ